MPGRVFVLGAGASRHDTRDFKLPMPLSREFFLPSYLKEHWHELRFGSSFDRSQLGQLLTHYFGWANDEDFRVNIEDVYSFLEITGRVFSGNFWYRERLPTARRQLLEYLAQLIFDISFHSRQPLLHLAIAKSLKPEDSIISFNWDLLLDNALLKTRPGRRLLANQVALLDPFRHSSRVEHADERAFDHLHRGYIIKMHGAVNLTVCISPDCIRRNAVARFDADDSGTGDHWTCEACGGPTELLLVPPYFQKSYLSDRFLRLQASIALQKMTMAEEIIVIGYSFPDFDFQARAMMRASRFELLGETDDQEAFLRRVVIVNPEVKDESYKAKVVDLFGVDRSVAAYGHEIDLDWYESVDDFLDKKLSAKARKEHGRTGRRPRSRVRPEGKVILLKRDGVARQPRRKR